MVDFLYVFFAYFFSIMYLVIAMDLKSTKKEMSYLFLNNNDFFICPYCSEKLELNGMMLKCVNNHTFDIGKKGEVFLVKTNGYKNSKIYDRNLFLHRREFIKNNFYQKVYETIANYLNKNFNDNSLIVDLGCGEGIHTIKIQELLTFKNKLIGLDYSKSGINLATDFISKNNFYIVADTNNIPLKNNSTDIVIDFLSPFNAVELKRIMKDNGIIIKIAPGKNYLKEIKNKDYLNEDIVKENILKWFDIIDSFRISDSFDLNSNQINDLVNMTPMENDKLYVGLSSITIDLNIYILKIKHDI